MRATCPGEYPNAFAASRIAFWLRSRSPWRRAAPCQVNSRRKRVERLMREHRIVGITRRKRRALTKPDPSPVAPVTDLIRRDFTAKAPGQRFVGDITCLPTFEGWLYLATVIDLHTREVIGHAMAEFLDLIGIELSCSPWFAAVCGRWCRFDRVG